jgi:hypothetical protein
MSATRTAIQEHEQACLQWEIEHGQRADCSRPGAHRAFQAIVNDANGERLHCWACYPALAERLLSSSGGW